MDFEKINWLLFWILTEKMTRAVVTGESGGDSWANTICGPPVECNCGALAAESLSCAFPDGVSCAEWASHLTVHSGVCNVSSISWTAQREENSGSIKPKKGNGLILTTSSKQNECNATVELATAVWHPEPSAPFGFFTISVKFWTYWQATSDDALVILFSSDHDPVDFHVIALDYTEDGEEFMQVPQKTTKMWASSHPGEETWFETEMEFCAIGATQVAFVVRHEFPGMTVALDEITATVEGNQEDSLPLCNNPWLEHFRQGTINCSFNNVQDQCCGWKSETVVTDGRFTHGDIELEDSFADVKVRNGSNDKALFMKLSTEKSSARVTSVNTHLASEYYTFQLEFAMMTDVHAAKAVTELEIWMYLDVSWYLVASIMSVGNTSAWSTLNVTVNATGPGEKLLFVEITAQSAITQPGKTSNIMLDDIRLTKGLVEDTDVGIPELSCHFSDGLCPEWTLREDLAACGLSQFPDWESSSTVGVITNAADCCVTSVSACQHIRSEVLEKPQNTRHSYARLVMELRSTVEYSFPLHEIAIFAQWYRGDDKVSVRLQIDRIDRPFGTTIPGDGAKSHFVQYVAHFCFGEDVRLVSEYPREQQNPAIVFPSRIRTVIIPETSFISGLHCPDLENDPDVSIPQNDGPDWEAITIGLSTLGACLIVAIAVGVGVFTFRRRYKRVHLAIQKRKQMLLDILPKDLLREYEIRRSEVKMGRLIGSGNDGYIMLGQLDVKKAKANKKEVPVAIKICRSAAVRDDGLDDFVSETCLLVKLSRRHRNIVNFLDLVISSEVMLVMEYCQLGSMETFLHRHKDSLTSSHSASNSLECTYCHVQAAHKPLEIDDLGRFGSEISRGMDFLSTKGIVHRDLAARNIMIDASLVAKIGDFGMAREQDSETDVAPKKQNDKEGSIAQKTFAGSDIGALATALPIRWIPPECFDSASTPAVTSVVDVWSFGIVLWEIYSLGEVPYGNILSGKMSLDSAQMLYDQLKKGNRLEKPPLCPQQQFDVMKRCWAWDCSERPTFSALKVELESFLPNKMRENYVEFDPEDEHFNEKMDHIAREKRQQPSTLDSETQSVDTCL